MKKDFIVFIVFYLLLAIYGLLLPRNVGAVCPVCTVAVGAGLGLSRYLGIDDSVTGIWVGGLIISLTFWTCDWVSKKKFKFFEKTKANLLYIVSFTFYVLITFPPLYWLKVIGDPFNTMLGVDKLVFGTIIGIIAFLIGVSADKKVRKIKGKQLFIYQKVVFPVTSLVIASLLIYYYGGYLY